MGGHAKVEAVDDGGRAGIGIERDGQAVDLEQGLGFGQGQWLL
jgi:hypothetical protein